MLHLPNLSTLSPIRKDELLVQQWVMTRTLMAQSSEQQTQIAEQQSLITELLARLNLKKQCDFSELWPFGTDIFQFPSTALVLDEYCSIFQRKAHAFCVSSVVISLGSFVTTKSVRLSDATTINNFTL